MSRAEFCATLRCLALCATYAGVTLAARAQTDFVGDWDQAGGGIFNFQEEFIDRGGGPDLGDYVGLPINDALRYKASLYSPSWLTVPEHTCLPHPGTYAYRSPGGLSVVKEYDAVTQKVVAYRFYGTYGLARTIWMDGRAHPPVYARANIGLGNDQRNWLAQEFVHFRRHGQKLAAATEDLHGGISQDTQARSSGCEHCRLVIGAGIGIVAQAKKGEVIGLEPFEKLDRLGDFSHR